MKVSSFWKPFIVSLIATPIFCFFAVLLAGGGHGTYLPAKLLFPYTMISAFWFGRITVPLIVFSIIQFPVYGFTLAFANRKGTLILVGGFILFLHITAFILSLVIPSDSF